MDGAPHMPASRFLLAGCSVVLYALAQTAPPACAGQAEVEGDGLVRAELTLDGRHVRVAWDPALRSDHRSLPVLRAGSTRAAVRVGRLEGHGSLAVGTLVPDPDEPAGAGLDHDLWLMRTAAGWVLDARPVEDAAPPAGDTAGENAPDAAVAGSAEDTAVPSGDAAGENAPDAAAEGGRAAVAGSAEESAPDTGADAAAESVAENASDTGAAAAESVEGGEADEDGEVDEGEETDEAPRPGRILLAHRARAAEAETLAFGLRPTGDTAGTLTLSWGRSDWTADFEFVELPPRPRPPRTSDVGPGTSLTADSDLEARYRAAALGARNETALVTPGGARLQVLFQQELGTDGVDFAALESIADGELVQLTQGAVIRLRSEAPLRFGDTLVPIGNLAPGFPGSYGLWLRAAGSGWTLVFNNEPDSWGTQHDPAFDAAEVDVAHTYGGPYQERPLSVSLAPVDAAAARLEIHWGRHTWAADFTIEP